MKRAGKSSSQSLAASVRPIVGRIVVATHNSGKLDEFKGMLAGYGLEIVSAGQLGLPSPEETGATFTENAILKAKAAAVATGSLALADDSGLCVTALGNRPGIYSARWAIAEASPSGAKEPGKDFNAAMQRIQDELGDVQDRSAFFICVLALYWPDGTCEHVEGRIDGTIAKTPRGANGHGYDPIFIPQGGIRTFAEMTEQEKNKISHRWLATKALVKRFFAPIAFND